MTNSTKKLLLITGLVLIVAAMRLIPHPFNFTPVVAICLFSVAVINHKYLKFVIPAIAILYSDVLLEISNGYGFHNGTGVVYLSFAVILIGGYFLLKKVSIKNVVVTSLLASFAFFLITNFAFFYPISAVNNPSLGQYTHDFSGIMASYTAGLPFFRNMLVGDLFYTGVLFGLYSAIQQVPALRFSKQ
ncbi:hypothetical protein SAMN06298216_4365 [Spirosomataceae bacterium TFI 002]|nr:hypothetical protein SAMN06298216_4365 [Spirosomataceae bacterium TFI 002]